MENKKGVVPKDTSSLSLKGVVQSYITAFRILPQKIDLIVTSTLDRSNETGFILKKILRTPLFQHSIFNERTKTILTDDEKSNFIQYESATSLHQRCEHGLAYLQSRDESTIVVVSHASWIKMVVYQLKKISDVSYDTFNADNGLKNTSIVHIILTDNGESRVLSVRPPFFKK